MSTDRELRRRWEENRAEWAKLRRRTSEDAKLRIAELEREAAFIGYEWNDLFARKQRGEMTDPHASDMVIRTAREHMLMYGDRLEFQVIEGYRGSDHIADTWFVLAVPQESDPNPVRLLKYATAVTHEIVEADPDVLLRQAEVDGALYSTGETARFFAIRKLGDDLPPVVIWMIDGWPWEGPGPPFQFRDKPRW